ncbi:hypothetical protein F2Q70_00008427 [Brassica cretica]|uniref:Uncharacterized protein n=1 Tax=Brassica cretica TaxID=69181 RepID=A0A8S9M561_BRACR|nr:hypothetical protein F2Q70_00008427 [Brassica cretica]KAF3543128.1 hypothetical protein DY000_02001921 [Brassica cretica]
MASGDCLLPDITLDLLDSADFSVSLGRGYGLRFSMTTSVEVVLGESLTASVSTLDLSSHPGAASASLLSRGGGLDILCRFLEAFRFVGGSDYNPLLFGCGGLEFVKCFIVSDSYESRASGTSYSRGNLGSPGIRGNEENLTFPRSLPMVENGDRFLRISKIRLVERAGFSG